MPAKRVPDKSSPNAPLLTAEGDCAIRVQFGERIDPNINRQVHTFCKAVLDASIAGIVECVPAYCVATVYYEPSLTNHEDLREPLAALAAYPGSQSNTSVLVEIPVIYGGEFGPDLAEVADRLCLSEAEIVSRHPGRPYLCYMIGFMPGFPYLGELPADLKLPRRETPRVRVPAGSVAIADAQTGIYPKESPGGWHLIGRTPLHLFNPAADPPAIIQPGDMVQFVSVDPAQFAAIEHQVQLGEYSIKRTTHEC